MPTKVFIYPPYRDADNGDGGIRRVVEAQRKWLPAFGIQVVDHEEDADIIAAHAVLPETYYRHYPEKLYVSHCHGMYWSDLNWDGGHRAINAAVLNSIRVADAVTAPTQWVANAIRRHSSRFVLEVPHGIDLVEWTPRDDGLGYVYWDKSRVDLTCDPTPFNDLSARMPDVKFVATFGQVRPNTMIVGRLPHERAREAMSLAGVYLATSKETGQSMSVLEALAAGVPVVGYRWGGVAETITHGVDGYLAEPNNVEDLERGILWALKHRSEISAKCRETAARYPWSDAIEQYAALYDELIAQREAQSVGVSIVVRARDMERWLSETLDSVAGQTFTDWECIVVDDASTDSTAAIAEAYAAKDSRYRVIHNDAPVGPGEAHNVGMRAARGRYLMSLDADDRFASNGALTVLTAALDKDRELHAAYGNVLFEQPDGKLWHSSWPIETNVDEWFERNQVGQPMPYCTLMRRAVWELTGGYRPRCRTSEDQDFWLRASSYGFVARYVTEMDVLHYRQRPGSLTDREGFQDHRSWFPWRESLDVMPAAAVSKRDPVVHSCEPVVSVIIPCGPGHERYVKDAVDSVDAQTFRLFECIVVNDTDEELELPAWVRTIETDGRIGVAGARNLGVHIARSQLLFFLDADDFMQRDCLMTVLRAFYQGENSPIVYSDFWENPEPDFNTFKVYQTKDWDPGLLIQGCVHPVSALVPRELFNRVGGFDEQLEAWEDWDFWFKCAELGWPSRRVAAPLWTYRKDTGERRAANYESRGVHKESIMARWGGYWTGEKTMPGCNSCSGRNRTVNPMMGGGPMGAAPTPDGSRDDSYVEIEHLAAQVATWRGVVAGIPAYRFQAHSRAYVHPRDAQHFLQFPDSFKLVDSKGVATATPLPPAGVMELFTAPLGASTPPPPPPPVSSPRPRNPRAGTVLTEAEVAPAATGEGVPPAGGTVQPPENKGRGQRPGARSGPTAASPFQQS